MKQFYLLLLLSSVLSTTIVAQERPSCQVFGSSTLPGNSLCDACPQNITSTGVITGDINFFLGKDDVYAIPLECDPGEGQTVLSLGDATFTIFPTQGNNRGTLDIPGNILIDPSAVDFLVQTNTDRGNVTVTFGTLTADRNDLPALTSLIQSSAEAAPIELLSWTATPEGNFVTLTWSSAMELNNDFYGIEHSTDGVSFSEITRIPGRDLSIEQLNYSFTHTTPSAGTNYYRLTQTDLDGTRTTFDVLTVAATVGAAATLSPNPATAGTQVSVWNVTADTDISLLRIDGSLVAQYPAASRDLPQLALPADLPAGVYLVRAGEQVSRLLVR